MSEERPIPREEEFSPAEASAGSTAEELVAHGLLEFHHRRDQAAQDARVRRVMDALQGPIAIRSPRRVRWIAMATAAMIVIGAVFLQGVFGESSASAEVSRSIEKARAAGDRRYEVYVGFGSEKETRPRAIIDMRGPSLLVVRHEPPWSQSWLVVGRDVQGMWALTNSGETERSQVAQYWPPWSVDEDETPLVDSIDRVLEQLKQQYTLTRGEAAALPDRAGAMYDRITAKRTQSGGPHPDTVELWIDTETHQAVRIEMRWSSRPMGGPHAMGKGHGHGFGPPRAMDEHGPDMPPPSSEHKDKLGDEFHPPMKLDGGMTPGARHHGGGPPTVVIQAVDTPTLPADWFTPQRQLADREKNPA